MADNGFQGRERLSAREKEAGGRAWYREWADRLDRGRAGMHGPGGVPESRRMRVNYDLFNNVLDLSDFEYVCRPFGAGLGELPARMANRDISSGKIKAMLGMEMKRPFAWRAVAVNPEATTRREQEEAGRIREWVVGQLSIDSGQSPSIDNGQLTMDNSFPVGNGGRGGMEKQAPPPPDEVRKYMLREHQDPAEVLSQQVLEYLLQELDVKRKFNRMFKHGLLSGVEVAYVGAPGGRPCLWPVNPLRFSWDRSPDTDFIEDGEWAACEYRMSPSEVVAHFGGELTGAETDMLYREHRSMADGLDFFAASEGGAAEGSVPVLHCTWKALRKVGFLTYVDGQGVERETLVDERYRMDGDAGDVRLDWEWMPEVYEAWKVKLSEPVYLGMRPVPGQFRDLGDMWRCKLPYHGAAHDGLNSEPTSLMDRLKVYQYYYNMLWYKFELLAATDKGKKVLMNINMVPDSAGIDVAKWQYFMESTPYMWYDPNEEGSSYADANTVAKVVDLSYAGQMNQYIEMMEYVRQQAGRSVGITDQVEGQIGPREAVRNAQQSLIQSSHILEPYFDLHDCVKRNVLQALLEQAKAAWADSPPESLTYILDDMSLRTLTRERFGMLSNNTFGIFVANSGREEEVLQSLRQLSHAAMQSQKAELSDVISLLRQNGIAEAEETLRAAEQRRAEREEAVEEARNRAQQQLLERQAQLEREKREHEMERMEREYDRRERLEVVRGSLVAASYNPDTDRDGNGVNDFVERAEAALALSGSMLRRDGGDNVRPGDGNNGDPLPSLGA